MLENFEYWNNDEFFFALDISQDYIPASKEDIVKHLLDYRDIKQLGCWRILFRDRYGIWCELKHNGSTFTKTAAIDQDEWVWKLLNAID